MWNHAARWAGRKEGSFFENVITNVYQTVTYICGVEVVGISHPLAAPLKSKMTWLKGPKVDQLPNLFNAPKSVGTFEELLIMP